MSDARTHVKIAPLSPVLCLAIVSAWPAPCSAEWSADFDAGLRYDSNLTRAQHEADISFADERTRAYEELGYRGRVANLSFAYSY